MRKLSPPGVVADYRRTVLIALFVVAAGGCAAPQYAKVRKVPRNPLNDKLQLASWWGPKPSDRTIQVLRRYDLAKNLQGDQRELLAQFRTVLEAEPSPDKLYTMAELSYLAGRKTEGRDKKLALDFYGSACAHAYLYLFDERYHGVRNPYDPQFRGACDLYNGALESSLRLIAHDGSLSPGNTLTVETANRRCDINVVVQARHWKPEDFERFEFVSDYDVSGLTNQYQTFGLGVPLIAVCKRNEQRGPDGRYYPPEMRFPVTAFLRVVPPTNGSTDMSQATAQALLELHDPLESTNISVAGARVPLESDLSTPLARFMNDPQLNRLATFGLLRPDQSEKLTGIYMLQPYEADKIPVIFVHGLWSSPLTWVEMFNDLRSHPEIRQSFQFWFYLYPTGQPFWHSATRMRIDLAELRRSIDPQLRATALDQTVLVGHSMGGLVSKLQTVDSGDEFWRIVSDRPFHEVQASDDRLEQLRQTFFFEANPSVRRVITIGTPHRGSKFANDYTQWLSHKLIYLPTKITVGREELLRANPDLLRDPTMLRVKTSIDSLAPESPILPVMLTVPSPSWVKYHTVIGVLPNEGLLGHVAGGTDGVVAYESARLENASSELVVNADHNTVHRHPLTVLEVRRILLEHLHELQQAPSDGLPKVYRASNSEVAP